MTMISSNARDIKKTLFTGLVFLFCFLAPSLQLFSQSRFYKRTAKESEQMAKALALKPSTNQTAQVEFFEVIQSMCDKNQLEVADSLVFKLMNGKPPAKLFNKEMSLLLNAYMNKKIENNPLAIDYFKSLDAHYRKKGILNQQLFNLYLIEYADYRRSLGELTPALIWIDSVKREELGKSYFLNSKYLHRKASIYGEGGKQELAMQLSLENIELAKKHRDPSSIGISYNEYAYWCRFNLGIEESKKTYITAENYLRGGSLRIFLDTKFNHAMLHLHNNWQPEKGHKMILEIFDSLKHNPIEYDYAKLYLHLHSHYKQQNNHELALKYFLKYHEERIKYSDRKSFWESRRIERIYDNELLSLEKAHIQEDFIKTSERLNQEQSKNILYVILIILFTVGATVTTILLIRLKRYNERLAFQDKVNKHAIALVSHDLKGSVYSLVNLADAKLSPEQLNKKLTKESNQIKEMTESLLGWLRASSKSPEQVEVSSISLIVGMVKKDLQDKINSKGIEIITEEKTKQAKMELPGDVLRIALRNILSNAVKYSLDRSTIIIRYVDNHIEIQDFGIGISEEKLHQLLKNKVESTVGTEGEQGYGIGLMLTRELLLEYKFKIEIETAIDEGSTFKIVRE